MDEKFEWNGTQVNCQVLKAIYKDDLLLWKIQEKEGNGYVWCFPLLTRNPFPCLIDECKPLFGLEKMGTRWCKLYCEENKKQETFLLYKIHLSERGKLILPYFKEKMNEGKVNETRKIILFRYVFSLPFPRKNSIMIVGKKIISCKEFQYSKSKNYFSVQNYERWFKEKTPSQVLREMLEIKDEREIVFKIYTLKKKIIEKIEFLYPKLSGLANIFYERALARCRRK